MALYYNGKKMVNSLVVDGSLSKQNIILEGTDTTNKWAEPLVYDDINVLDYDLLCFKGKLQNTSFTMYFHTEDLPISQTAGQGNNYIVILTYGFLYIDTNGYLYFYVETGKTLILNEIIVC
jgi:hypothetical protein